MGAITAFFFFLEGNNKQLPWGQVDFNDRRWNCLCRSDAGNIPRETPGHDPSNTHTERFVTRVCVT